MFRPFEILTTNLANDTLFIAPLQQGQIPCPEMVWRAYDLSELNRKAIAGEGDIIKISSQIYPQVKDTYQLLPVGATIVDEGGPLVVSRHHFRLSEHATKTIAIPGYDTTAYALLQQLLPAFGQIVVVPYQNIIGMVTRGEVDAGLLIHQREQEQLGLPVIYNLGTIWRNQTSLPLPLGLWVVRKSLYENSESRILVEKMIHALRQAYDYGRQNVGQILAFMTKHAPVKDAMQVEKDLFTWTNNRSRDLDIESLNAINRLSNFTSLKKI